MNSDFILCVRQLKKEIKLLEKEVQACVRERDFKYAKHYQKALWRTQNELDRLTSFAEKKHYVDEQEIDDALVEVYQGEIQSFSLILQPYQDFYLDFSLSADKLIDCRLPTEEELNKAYVYVYIPKFKRHIIGLGFEESDTDKRLSQKFVLPPNYSCIDIKAKLSVLMFNVLHIDIKQPFQLIKRNEEDHHLTSSPAATRPPSADPKQGATVCVGS